MKQGLFTLLAVFARLVLPAMPANGIEVKTMQMTKRLISVFLLMLLALPAMSQEQTPMPEIMIYHSDDYSYVTIEINCPNNESAVIHFRIDNWSEDEWNVYEWPLYYGVMVCQANTRLRLMPSLMD